MSERRYFISVLFLSRVACRVGSLQIRQSLESDEGRYECVAENSVGIAYSYAADLYVRGTTPHAPSSRTPCHFVPRMVQFANGIYILYVKDLRMKGTK